MYYQKLVAVIKVNGKILREYGDEVKLPFGSEYVIELKNMNTQRAIISIEIDGTNVLEGRSLVIDANKSKEITRFIKNGNLETGPKFKFIKKTEQISNHRGNKIDDGIIRIQYQFEESLPFTHTTAIHHHTVEHHHHYNQPLWETYQPFSGGIDDITFTTVDNQTTQYTSINAQCCTENVNINNLAGITVGGEDSYQQFKEVYIDRLENTKYVICIKLVGITKDECLVTKPVTIQSKKECPTCGTMNTSKYKFCHNCGTNLNW